MLIGLNEHQFNLGFEILVCTTITPNDAVFGIKAEIESLVISILIHSIQVAYSGRPVSFYYITGASISRMQL